MSLWAFGRQLSGSELHNGSAAAHNADVNVQLEERCSCVPHLPRAVAMQPGCWLGACPLLISCGSLPKSPDCFLL